ncbi:MAG TPA: DegT/DnrJ/EryC1/StrS family aminotransferase [Acidimicrobiales bacterium]|nr:DegT/DnrJ/EryC1/StrS family aminotransferase [Acidimicrobiales bacterium]
MRGIAAGASSPESRPAATVPFVDVQRQTAELADDLLEAIRRVVASGCFIGGPEVTAFEREFADLLGVPGGIGCSSGTSALSLALAAAGVEPGSEVITVPNTFFGTVEAIISIGASPVFVDIDPATYTMAPDGVEEVLTEHTRAILPVHLYGTPADMDPIMAIARPRGLVVVEDAAQAHLARYRDRPVGALGDAAGFSFYPAKNLGALGDAGYISSADPALLERAARIADHGRASKYEHTVVGFNHRLDAIQAAALRVKMIHLGRWTEARRAHAATYEAILRPLGFKTIEVPVDVQAVHHLYVVEVANRSEIMSRLAAARIECGIHYPIPLHLQPALAYLGYSAGSFPKSEQAASRVLSLPLDPEMTDAAIERVCEVFCAVARP